MSEMQETVKQLHEHPTTKFTDDGEAIVDLQAIADEKVDKPVGMRIAPTRQVEQTLMRLHADPQEGAHQIDVLYDEKVLIMFNRWYKMVWALREGDERGDVVECDTFSAFRRPLVNTNDRRRRAPPDQIVEQPTWGKNGRLLLVCSTTMKLINRLSVWASKRNVFVAIVPLWTNEGVAALQMEFARARNKRLRPVSEKMFRQIVQEIERLRGVLEREWHRIEPTLTLDDYDV